MKATIILLLFFPLFLFTLNIQKTEAAPYQHPETGLLFEETMGGLTKGNVRNFEEKYPGLGVSIGYNAPGITATVYIYNLGLGIFVIGEPDFYEMLLVDQEEESAQTRSVTLGVAQ